MGSLAGIIWTEAFVLLALWVAGLRFNIGGWAASGFIHVLLVLALLLVIYNVVMRLRAL